MTLQARDRIASDITDARSWATARIVRRRFRAGRVTTRRIVCGLRPAPPTGNLDESAHITPKIGRTE